MNYLQYNYIYLLIYLSIYFFIYISFPQSLDQDQYSNSQCIQETNIHNFNMELAGAKNGLLPSNPPWIIKKTNCEQI